MTRFPVSSLEPVSIYRNNDPDQGLAPARDQTNPLFWQTLHGNGFAIKRFAELLDAPIDLVKMTLKQLWAECRNDGWQLDFGPDQETMELARDRNVVILSQLKNTAVEVFKRLNQGGMRNDHLKTIFVRYTTSRTAELRRKLKYSLDPQKSGGKRDESPQDGREQMTASNTSERTAFPVPHPQRAVSRGDGYSQSPGTGARTSEKVINPVHDEEGNKGKLHPKRQSTFKVIDRINSESESDVEIVTSLPRAPPHPEEYEQTEYSEETHNEDHSIQTPQTPYAPYTGPATNIISSNGLVDQAARVRTQSMDTKTTELFGSGSRKAKGMLKRTSTSLTEDTDEEPPRKRMDLTLRLEEAEAELKVVEAGLKVARLRRQLAEQSAWSRSDQSPA